ncbi:MAG: sigma-70 family RNA polymerase sigma factor [Bacteroidota bacterium]
MDSQRVFDGFLVLQYRSGDKGAMGLLVKRHHLAFCRHSWGYTRDMEASKDIVQDCWRIILKKQNGLKNPNAFSSWALRIVTRKTLDYLNRRRRDRQHLEALQKEAVVSQDQEGPATETELLRKAIWRLPPNQQRVLRLFYVQGYALREVSDILGVSVGTVKSRLFHAREKLKVVLKKEMNSLNKGD